ncbi:hypothetical protein [Nitrospira sp. Nam74]
MAARGDPRVKATAEDVAMVGRRPHHHFKAITLAHGRSAYIGVVRSSMEGWISKDMLVWLSVGSGIGVLIGVVAIPLIIINLPADYLVDTQRQSWLAKQPAVIRVPLRLLKNLLAVVLIILGIAMLVLPGQGLLSILLGIALADFPGRLKLQRWILQRPKVMDSLNWIRQKFDRPRLQPPRHMQNG